MSDALRIRPQNLGAYALMIQINLEKGRHERVVEFARTMARIAAETGDSYLWPKSRRHLVEAGYQFEGDRVQAGPHVTVSEPAPAASDTTPGAEESTATAELAEAAPVATSSDEATEAV